MKRWIICAGLLAMSGPAMADTNFMSGERLNEKCRAYVTAKANGWRGTAQESMETGICLGFVEGAIDATATCVPGGVSLATAVDVVINYLDRYPQNRLGSGKLLVRLAIDQAYPCAR